MRVRRNADPRIRGLERAVSAGDASAIAPLVVSRLRNGEINLRLAKAAKFFSAPLTPPGSAGAYNWHPFSWEHNELETPPGEFAQDPRTLILHAALVEILGPRMRVSKELPKSVWEWADREGFTVSETGGVGNHAPLEIQSEDTVERWIGGGPPWEDDMEAVARVEARQVEIANEHRVADGESLPGRGVTDARPQAIDDDDYMWLVRRELFRGRANAIALMKWLRVHSTVEYCATLGANVNGPNSGIPRAWSDPEFGEAEFSLVSSYLGGAPL